MRVQIISLVTLAILLLASCARENVMPTAELANAVGDDQVMLSEDLPGEVDLATTMRTGVQCFRFVYPITVTFRGGNTLTLNSNAELQRLQNGLAGFAFVYPVGIAFPDGSTVRLRSTQDLRNAYTACGLRATGPGRTRGGRR